jgi:tRNA dimethylallyltransferase
MIFLKLCHLVIPEFTRIMIERPKNEKPVAIFLMGPTASGKTDLAIDLHKHLPVEIINVDSSQVYKGMDVGSAKPTEEILNKIRHRLINIRDPSEPYSVADFVIDAQKEMKDIVGQGRIPLLVGGAMLYFKALLGGLADNPPADFSMRKKIEADALLYGWPHLHKKLKKIDPELAKELHPNNSQRIQRALEIFYITGQTPSAIKKDQKKYGGKIIPISDSYRIIQIALIPSERAYLHERIEKRFKKILDAGFEAEVRLLHERSDLNVNLPAMRAAGYKQMWSYLTGTINYNEIADLSNAATRQLAKRQLTWLKKWPHLQKIQIDRSNDDKDNSDNKVLSDCLSILKRQNIYTNICQ